MYASLPCLPVQCLEQACAETRHRALHAVQMLEFLNVLQTQWKHTYEPSAAAPQGLWGRSPRSAVLPLPITLNSSPASHATLLLAYQFERLLRVLTTIPAQGVLADERSTPLSHPVCPEAGSRVPAVNKFSAEFRKGDQLKLSRWPWSMVGKEVCAQDCA
jgi:hypothetical protein